MTPPRTTNPQPPTPPYLTQVLSLNRHSLRAYLLQLTRNLDALDDLCQEVYLQLLRLTPSQAERITCVPAFARGVARHIALDWIKRNRTSRLEYSGDLQTSDYIDPHGDPEASVAYDQELTYLLNELQRLPAKRREVLTRVKLLGHSIREVAHDMDIEESTVKNHLQLAAKSCASALASEGLATPGSRLLRRLLRRNKRPESHNAEATSQQAPRWLEQLATTHRPNKAWPALSDWLARKAQELPELRTARAHVAVSWSLFHGTRRSHDEDAY